MLPRSAQEANEAVVVMMNCLDGNHCSLDVCDHHSSYLILLQSESSRLQEKTT